MNFHANIGIYLFKYLKLHVDYAKYLQTTSIVVFNKVTAFSKGINQSQIGTIIKIIIQKKLISFDISNSEQSEDKQDKRYLK